MGVSCTIFVPKGIDQAKYTKMLNLGASVRESAFPGYDDTLTWAEEEANAKKLHFISAFDDERIMAGNGGSLAFEILKELPETENIIVPVGGGGLSAGISFYVIEKKPACRIIGCQHKDSPALKLSLEKGYAITKLPAIETFAGGIEGGIGARCFDVLKQRIDEVVLLSEEEIIKGFRWMLEQHQYLIEPTSAVAIASFIFNKIPKLKGPTVIILTGRNVSYSTLQRLIH
jgi:threonine dehydratase